VQKFRKGREEERAWGEWGTGKDGKTCLPASKFGEYRSETFAGLPTGRNITWENPPAKQRSYSKTKKETKDITFSKSTNTFQGNWSEIDQCRGCL